MLWTNFLGTAKKLVQQYAAKNNIAINAEHTIEAQFIAAASKKINSAQLIPPPSEQCELCLTCCSEFQRVEKLVRQARAHPTATATLRGLRALRMPRRCFESDIVAFIFTSAGNVASSASSFLLSKSLLLKMIIVQVMSAQLLAKFNIC